MFVREIVFTNGTKEEPRRLLLTDTRLLSIMTVVSTLNFNRYINKLRGNKKYQEF